MADEVANAVNNETVAEPVTTDSAPVDNQTADGANAQVSDPNSDDFFDDIDAQVAEGDKETETEESTDESTEESPEEPQSQPRGEDGKFVKKEQAEEKPLAPKSENRFQQLANENRELKERLESLKLQESQIATEQELLNEINPETGDYYTPQEVQRLAFAQSREQQAQSVSQERYQLEVQQTQRSLANEADQALTEFPIFNEQSPEYNADLAADYDDLLSESLLYQMPDGNQYTAKVLMQNGINPQAQATLVGSYNSPLKLANIIAKATKANAPAYQAKAQKATEKMLANADVSSGATQATKTKVDPMMEAFDAEAALR